MDITFLLKGLILGFSIAAPVGPIGLLCIRRTLTAGRMAGFFSGLGAATADAIYGGIAGFGLTFISSFLIARQNWLNLGGGVFLCYLGLKALMAGPATLKMAGKTYGLTGAYVSTLFLTLTNPATILSFAAIFAGVGLTGTGGDYMTAGLLVLGVFSGSALWWLLLSSSTRLLQDKIRPSWLHRINMISGGLIFLFGLYVLASYCCLTPS